jgi:hypothetical protein
MRSLQIFKVFVDTQQRFVERFAIDGRPVTNASLPARPTALEAGRQLRRNV